LGVDSDRILKLVLREIIKQMKLNSAKGSPPAIPERLYKLQQTPGPPATRLDQRTWRPRSGTCSRYFVAIFVGLLGHSACLGFKTLLLIECGMAVLSQLLNAVITSRVGVIKPASLRGAVSAAIPREAETVPKAVVLSR